MDSCPPTCQNCHMDANRISPRAQCCLVGLSRGLTWEEIGARMGIGWRTVGRHIAQARAILGEDPNELIERSALIERATQAGIVHEGMRLSEGGYITFTVRSVVNKRG